MRENSTIIKVLTFVLVVLLGAGGLYFQKSTNKDKGVSQPDFAKKTIEVNGVEYFPRQDISTFLVIGIDEFGVVETSGSYRNNRNADVILLLVFNETEQEYTVVCLNRDTMVSMPILGVTGAQAGKQFQQLALSHTYGSGLVDSCENVRDTVSGLLNNVPIDNFISMNMDGIQIITDALGGVDVYLEEPLTEIDESLYYIGYHHLNGELATKFIQSRKGVGDQLNSSRMMRHKVYMQGIENAFKAKQDTNHSLLKNVYEELSDYMVSDCSINDFTTLVDGYMNYTCKDIIIPEGEYRMGDEFMEFYLNESKFQSLLIDLLYEPKKLN